MSSATNMILDRIQVLGKSLMLPIAVLPVAGILLRAGQPDLLNIGFIAAAGGAVFGHLALVFAIGVAVGVAHDNGGASGLAGAIAYVVLDASVKTINEHVDLGVFAGIISGLLAGYAYNKFHRTELPDWLGFFSGKRLVPIMAGLFSVIAAFILGYVWPPVQDVIYGVGNWVTHSGAVGAGVYGFLNRLLIPLGLHHIINVLIWFQFGDYTNASGEVVHGEINRFFAGDPNAGSLLAGYFPPVMFGLPGAALAMYVTAKPERKAQVGGMLMSVAITAFLTGITEPIEFSFMFLAPVLYLLHAIFTSASMFISAALGYKAGFTFSTGLVDLLLSWGISTKPWTIFIMGPIMFVLYFVVFTAVIKAFNLKTLGREDEDTSAPNITAASTAGGNYDTLARQYLKAVGGWGNIAVLNNCATRLRLTVRNDALIQKDVLKALGANGIVIPTPNNVQVIVGPKVDLLASAMKQIPQDEDLSHINASNTSAAVKSAPAGVAAGAVEVFAPASGKVLELDSVPDETFAERMVGDGIALETEDTKIYSPVKGEITSIAREKHAFMIRDAHGLEYLVHIGVDTVNLKGEPFTALVAEGAKVDTNTAVIEVNWAGVKGKVPSTAIMVLCTNTENMDSVGTYLTSRVEKGAKVFDFKYKK